MTLISGHGILPNIFPVIACTFKEENIASVAYSQYSITYVELLGGKLTFKSQCSLLVINQVF